MKRRTKFTLGLLALLFGFIGLSSCTASFCSNQDSSRILYRFDYGVTKYTDTPVEGSVKIAEFTKVDIYYTASYDNCSGLKYIVENAEKNNLVVPKALDYFVEFDKQVLELALTAKAMDTSFGGNIYDQVTKLSDIFNKDNYKLEPGVLDKYGYLKFYADGENAKLWNSYDEIHKKVCGIIQDTTLIPNVDFRKFYKQQMTTLTSQYRACIASEDGYYGSYGYTFNDKQEVFIQKKDWGYAWNKGFFEGLLVYPIGWCTEALAHAFSGAGAGGAAMLAILVVTFVIRGIMVLFTFKQSADTAKMNELQPQINKIQEKYPNSNTNQYEKQRMAEEMQKLYKKNNIHPFRSIITLIVQFPVFICVWGAMQGSASLSTGSFLGLNLNVSIKDALFNSANWGAENYSAVTALFLFILMSAVQAVSMLLPQWIQKAKAKKVSHLGKNPAAKSQNSKMKWFTYIMLAMIIFMGFSLVSAMGVYWLVGAVVSIIQTLVMQKITDARERKKKNS